MRPRPTPLALRLLRLARLSAHLFAGAVTALLVLPRLTPAARVARIQGWCRQLLGILNVHVCVHGPAPTAEPRRALFVSNHVSWLDIWVLKERHPMHFVAKADIRGWPVIGWLAAQTGTLFIKREKRSDTRRTLQEIEAALNEDACLCFFPEGTTTDGSRLLAFKPSLFQAAVNCSAEVWPLAIRYLAADGGINTEVAYCDDISMARSLWAVLKQREIRVELHYAAPLAAAGQERRHLAQQARHAIAQRLHPKARTAPETPAGLPDATR